MSLLHALRTLDDGIAKAEKVLLVLLVIFILGAVLLQVVGRLTGLNVPGAMEASTFAMLALSLFAGSVATHARRHIAIDVITRLVSAPVRTALSLIGHLTAFVLALFLARVALYFVLVNKMGGDYTSPALKIPFWIVQSLVPLAFAIMAFRFLLQVLDDANRIRTRNWIPPDAHHHGVDMRL